MKIYTKIGLVFVVATLISCESWLDLKPETEATEKEIFSTGDGYRSVLNGLYKSMGSGNLYGTELSFGIVDCISQQYNLELMDETDFARSYRAAGQFNYTDVSLEGKIGAIWKAAFNVVANANNLIQNIRNESPDLFAEHELEKNVLMGEAYACRALMHFELLRLFAPAPVHDDGRAYVPYVEVYPDIQAQGIAVQPFLEKVIVDLELARSLVAAYDTTDLGKSMSATGRSRFYNTLEFGMPGYQNEGDGFFRGRGYRLSYYSITALLARVYQYAERYAEAFQMAGEVMKYELNTGSRVYSFYTTDDFSGYTSGNAFEQRKDLKVVSNLIFAIYNAKEYEDNSLATFFKKEIEGGSTAKTWLVVNTEGQGIFKDADGTDESAQDYRSRYMIFYADGQWPVSGKWYWSEDAGIRDNNVTILPVIRATEMRYIMAECYARQNNFSEAYRILNDIRANRGCNSQLPGVGSWEAFVEELLRDARREWISEGQLFYLYKRLDAKVNLGSKGIRPLQREEYLLPIPDNQAL